MPETPETCWTIVRGAARGEARARGAFAETYLAIVRSFLAARWRGSVAVIGLDDAVQEVFLDLFKDRGALERFDPQRTPNFRPYLFGVVRTVALRHEERLAQERARRGPEPLDAESVASQEATLSRAFDRAWAQRMLTRAAERQRRIAAASGKAAERRVEILRLRFAEEMPIREIASAWGEDPARLHHEYATARAEFKEALREELGCHVAGTPGAIERECRALLDLLA